MVKWASGKVGVRYSRPVSGTHVRYSRVSGTHEKIARMANEEENCKGRFWEGRFRSVALLDEAALLSCMAYVDLNPIHAGMENDLRTSDFTSIQQRLYQFASKQSSKGEVDKVLEKRIEKQKTIKENLKIKTAEAPLMPFFGSSRISIHDALPFTREDYFLLVESTGRAIHKNKRGYIPPEIVPIVSRFNINPDKWLSHVRHFGRSYGYCAGASERIDNFTSIFKRRWGKGKLVSNAVYA